MPTHYVGVLNKNYQCLVCLVKGQVLSYQEIHTNTQYNLLHTNLLLGGFQIKLWYILLGNNRSNFCLKNCL